MSMKEDSAMKDASGFDDCNISMPSSENSYPLEEQSISSSNQGSHRLERHARERRLVKKWKGIIFPPRGRPAKYVTWVLILASFLGAMWSVFPEEMTPKHSLFGIVVTILLCLAAETLVVRIPMPKGFPPIPPLLVSLLMGLMLRNLPPPGNIDSYINDKTSRILRKIALTIILTNAGLEIDPEAMRKLKWAVIRLAFAPCVVETCLIGVFANLILGFPYTWSFMMGFVIAAVSPAVVVPSLIILQRAGWGVSKGVPTLVMAASGIDDVLAITGFTILLGIAIPTETGGDLVSKAQEFLLSIHLTSTTAVALEDLRKPNADPGISSFVNETAFSFSTPSTAEEEITELEKELASAAIELVLGVASGLFFGFLVSYIPHQKAKFKNFFRGFLLLSIGIFMVFATDMWAIGGAGTLCALIMSFTASLIWKDEKEPLAIAWHFMWIVFQPILFGLTGALVDVSEMDATTVGLGLAVLGIALVGRLMTSTAVTFGLDFNVKEKLFVSIAWIPKGTVQAALGSAALEKALQFDRPEYEVKWGQQILVLAVLITLITAPLGSFGISLAGPRLLKNMSLEPRSDSEDRAESQSYPELHSDSESNSNSNVETEHKHSTPSLDSGIILKPSRLEEDCNSAGKINASFEEDTESTVL